MHLEVTDNSFKLNPLLGGVKSFLIFFLLVVKSRRWTEIPFKMSAFCEDLRAKIPATPPCSVLLNIPLRLPLLAHFLIEPHTAAASIVDQQL